MVVSTERGRTRATAPRRASGVLALLFLSSLLLASLAMVLAVAPSPGPATSAAAHGLGEVAPSAPRAVLPASTSELAPPARAPHFPPPTDGWPLFQGNPQRTGDSVDPAPATTNVAWSVSLPTGLEGSSSVTAGLVTSGDLLYVASDNDVVYAYDQTDGTLAWDFATSGALEATPAVDEGMLLVGSTDGHLYELNSTTGAEIAKISLGGPDNTTSPLPIGGNVVVPCKARNLCEFNLSTQAQVWNTTVGPLSVSPAYDPSTGMILVGTDDGVLWGLQADGAKVWGYNAGGGSAITSSPIVGTATGIPHPLVFGFSTTPSGSGDLFAINETTMTYGAHPLYISYFAEGTSGSGVLTSSEIIAPTLGGTVLAFTPSTGAPISPWDPTPWPANSNPIEASLIDTEGGTLLVAMQGDQPGGNGGGELAELDDSTGLEVDTLPATSTTNPMVSTPAIDSSAIFLADRDGVVYAIGPALPSAPQTLKVVPGNESLAISWHAPASDGGVRLSQYQIEYSWTVGGVTTNSFVNISSSSTTENLTGLANGVAYQVDVSATNAEGAGPAASTSATTGAVPYPPQEVTPRAYQHTFQVSWQPPAPGDDGGFPVTSYTIQYWNSSSATGATQNATGVTGTTWLEVSPDGVVDYARVAAVNARGASIFSGVVSGTPELVNGILSIQVEPSQAWASAQISVQSVPSVPYTVSNGTAIVSVSPGTYWVNATASGYQSYDQQVTVKSGQVADINITLTKAPKSPVGLSTLEFALVVGGVAALLIVGLVVLGIRSRRLASDARGGEDEEEEQGPPSEGFSESQARDFLQPDAPAPELGSSNVLPDDGVSDDGGTVTSYAPASGSEPAEPEPEDDGAPEGASGRLGEYLSRRKAAKETLKSPAEDTPDGNEGPSSRS